MTLLPHLLLDRSLLYQASRSVLPACARTRGVHAAVEALVDGGFLRAGEGEYIITEQGRARLAELDRMVEADAAKPVAAPAVPPTLLVE